MKRTTLVAQNSKIAPEPERLDLVVRGGTTLRLASSTRLLRNL